MPPRTAGFGNRDRFELNGKIGLHRAAGLIVLRECRQWQHIIAARSGSIPSQPARFLGRFNLWRIEVAENTNVFRSSHWKFLILGLHEVHRVTSTKYL
jgi:hypothetical protein